MSKIKNIRDLRDHALQTLEDLKSDKISIQQAATNGALYSSVISTIKAQLDYAKAIDEPPKIEFMNAGPIYEIEQSKMKSLSHSEIEDNE